MDGHDENTDGVGFGQNNQPMSPVTPNSTNNLSQDTDSNLPGVIVSTPDIAMPQVYNAADYIDHPAGLGDIKLNNGKKSKKWLWAMLGAVVVLIVGIVIGMVIMFLRPDKGEVKASLSDFISYAQYGPKSAQYEAATNFTGEKEWFIEYLGEFSYMPTEQNNYITSLRDKFATFRLKLDNSKLQLSQEVEEAIYYSEATLKALLLYLNLDGLTNQLIATYDSDGLSVADSQVDELVNLQGVSEATNGLVSSMQDYLTAGVHLRGIYDENYCIISGIVQSICTQNITSSRYKRLFSASESSSFNMARYFAWGVIDLKANLKIISEWLSE